MPLQLGLSVSFAQQDQANIFVDLDTLFYYSVDMELLQLMVISMTVFSVNRNRPTYFRRIVFSNTSKRASSAL